MQATKEAKSLDEMTFMQLGETMKLLGVSDKKVKNLNDARLQIRAALKEAPKTSDWLPGKVRYL